MAGAAEAAAQKQNAGPRSKQGPACLVRKLSAKLELFEDRGVAIEVGALQVVEELTTASGHCDEAAA